MFSLSNFPFLYPGYTHNSLRLLHSGILDRTINDLATESAQICVKNWLYDWLYHLLVITQRVILFLSVLNL